MQENRKRRAAARIAELSGQGLDLVSFWRASSEAVAAAVPHYGAPCWFTLDPASLLATCHFQEGLPTIPAAFLAHEYLAEDVNKMADVARSAPGVATLHDATGGDPRRSPRYEDQMVPFGVEQEMVAGIRTASGEVWGAISVYREPGEPRFDRDDAAFMRTVSPWLADGARRALLIAEATDPDSPEAPGLLLLDTDWAVTSMTAGVQQWLRDLPDGDWDSGRLPAAVLAVAGQALRTANGTDTPGEVAVARVRSRSGRWLVLHGETLISDSPPRVAVILQPAHQARIVSLLMAAYRLTEAEQRVTLAVLQGSSTTDIAAELCISPHTVQQHLKGVFAKTGVRSRRALVGRVFFNHYEGRLRDNEQRTAAHLPARGGPMPNGATPTTPTGI